MIFVYKKWAKFCKTLKENGLISIPAKDVIYGSKSFIVLKHDVETNVKKAYKMSLIEHKFGHRGSYYVQAYLMHNEKNIILLKKMQVMGHEISYHYDVMDSTKGDFDKAMIEFESNKRLFEKNGFELSTVCQHGNPLIERKGYASNRDFFRDETVKKTYPLISDIMVNYKFFKSVDYLYFSDAGRKFKMIYDPLYNDIINSDDKNIGYDNLVLLAKQLHNDGCYIISTHPHRWTNFYISCILKNVFFKLIKAVAIFLYKIPFMRKVFSKYYYLAKKI